MWDRPKTGLRMVRCLHRMLRTGTDGIPNPGACDSAKPMKTLLNPGAEDFASIARFSSAEQKIVIYSIQVPKKAPFFLAQTRGVVVCEAPGRHGNQIVKQWFLQGGPGPWGRRCRGVNPFLGTSSSWSCLVLVLPWWQEGTIPPQYRESTSM